MASIVPARYSSGFFKSLDHAEHTKIETLQIFEQVLEELHDTYVYETMKRLKFDSSLWLAMVARLYAIIETLPVSHQVDCEAYEVMRRRLVLERKKPTEEMIHAAIQHLVKLDSMKVKHRSIGSIFRPLSSNHVSSDHLGKTLASAKTFFLKGGVGYDRAMTQGYFNHPLNEDLKTPSHEIRIALRQAKYGISILDSKKAFDLINKVDAQKEPRDRDGIEDHRLRSPLKFFKCFYKV